MTNDVFEPLAVVLKDYFGKPLWELPEDLRARVKRDFFGLEWNKVTEDKRRAVAAQSDTLHCPQMQAQIKRAEDLGNEHKRAKDAADTWQTRAAPTAIHQAIKDDRLKAAQERLDALDAQLKHERGDYVVASESGPAAKNQIMTEFPKLAEVPESHVIRVVVDDVEWLDQPGDHNVGNGGGNITKKKMRTRVDAMSEAIEEAIRLVGDAWTPHQIMTKLRSFAGKPESCITGVVADGVEWVVGRDARHVLDMDALRHRLERRSKRLTSLSPMSS